MPFVGFTIDHLSGRYNRSPALLARQVLRSVRAGCHVITGTEVDFASRGDVLERIARRKGYTLIRGADGWRGESFILVRNDVQVVESWLWVLDEDLPGMRAGMIAPAAVVERRGARLLVTTTHTPSGVEDDFRRPATTPEETAYIATVRGWCDRIATAREIRQNLPAAALADWNLDLDDPHNRAVLAGLFDGRLRLPASHLTPKAGTHGRRLIDGPAVAGAARVESWTVLRRHPASDHRGTRIRVTVPAKENPVTDPRLARPLWRGRTNVDALTIACVEHAEQIGGHAFVVTQGSYQAGAGDANSAGTHDLGGVVDLRWCGHDSCVKALREAGMAAWHRTPAQGPWPDHVHAVVVGHPYLAASAAAQVTDYLAGRNGLASHGPDDGPRLDPIPRPVWPWPPTPPEDDMPYTDWPEKDQQALAQDVADLVVKQLLYTELENGSTVRNNIRKAGDTKQLAKEIASELDDLADQLP